MNLSIKRTLIEVICKDEFHFHRSRVPSEPVCAMREREGRDELWWDASEVEVNMTNVKQLIQALRSGF